MIRSSRLPLAVALLPLLVLSACACRSRPAPAAAVPEVDQPSPYRRACASCHGVDGRGGGPAAAALRTPPADLTLLAARNGGVFPRAAVVAAITGAHATPAHGTRDMPVWSIRFEPSDAPTAVASIVAQQRIDAIVAEIEALQRSEGRRGQKAWPNAR